MPEPAFIEQQRTLLREFRQASARRAQAEGEAEARRQAEAASADAALNQARQTAAAQLATARQSQDAARSGLAEVGLQGLLGQARATPSAPRPDVAPPQELSRAAAAAAEAARNIQAGVRALQQWREAEQQRQQQRARRRRQLIIAAVSVGTVLLIVAMVLM